MKIAIDITQVVYGTGVSTYTRNLVENLLDVDKKNKYILFGGYLRRKTDLETFVKNLSGNFDVRFFPIPPLAQNILWNYLHIMSVDKLIGKVDLFHSSDWSQPPTSAAKVTTIHDLVPIKYPSLSEPRLVLTHRKRLQRVVDEVDKIIVPSQTTKNDLIMLGFVKDKVQVIPEAPSPIFKPAKGEDVEKILRKYRISGDYLITVGITPRKNTKNIIASFEHVKANMKSPLKLVIVGHAFMKLDTPRGVVTLGHVENKDLPILYSGAEALVYPSIYEGFGLPILEAFACNTPVVTSNYGSMAEVAGAAARLVDPSSVESITDGIMDILKHKDRYVELGSARSREFNWRQIAKDTLGLYNSIIG